MGHRALRIQQCLRGVVTRKQRGTTNTCRLQQRTQLCPVDSQKTQGNYFIYATPIFSAEEAGSHGHDYSHMVNRSQHTRSTENSRASTAHTSVQKIKQQRVRFREALAVISSSSHCKTAPRTSFCSTSVSIFVRMTSAGIAPSIFCFAETSSRSEQQQHRQAQAMDAFASAPDAAAVGTENTGCSMG